MEHCRRGGGGLYYRNRDEFVEALRALMTRSKLREQLGESGRQYVRQYYRWEAVLGRFERLVTMVQKPRVTRRPHHRRRQRPFGRGARRCRTA